MAHTSVFSSDKLVSFDLNYMKAPCGIPNIFSFKTIIKILKFSRYVANILRNIKHVSMHTFSCAHVLSRFGNFVETQPGAVAISGSEHKRLTVCAVSPSPARAKCGQREPAAERALRPAGQGSEPAGPVFRPDAATRLE